MKSTLLAATLALLPHLSCNQPTTIPPSQIQNLETRLTEANQRLRDFPDSIPGALKISKHVTPEAKYCLVHIRQVHYVSPDRYEALFKLLGVSDPKERLDIISKRYDFINNIQQEIYKILSYLTVNGISTEVYVEGITNEHTAETFTSHVQGCKEEISDMLGVTKASELSYVSGAGILLGLEGSIKIKPATTLESDMATINATTSEEERELQEQREDVLLELIANQNNRLVFTVYGALHAWGGEKSSGPLYILSGRKSTRDNIAEWNQKHPNKKFSLIEIIPKGYFQSF